MDTEGRIFSENEKLKKIGPPFGRGGRESSIKEDNLISIYLSIISSRLKIRNHPTPFRRVWGENNMCFEKN